jgi:hypothetical protein
LTKTSVSMSGALRLLEQLRRSDWLDGSATVLRSVKSVIQGLPHRVEIDLHLSSTVFLSIVTLHPEENRKLKKSSIAALGAALQPLGYRLLTGLPERSSKVFRRRLPPSASLTTEGKRLLRTVQDVPASPRTFKCPTEPALAVSRRNRLPEKRFRRALAWCAVAARNGWRINAIGRSHQRRMTAGSGVWSHWCRCYVLPPTRNFSIGLFLYSPIVDVKNVASLKRLRLVRRINREMSRLNLKGTWFRGPKRPSRWMADFDRTLSDPSSLEAQCRRLDGWTIPRDQRLGGR